MVCVCAWCQRYLGSKEPFANPAVSHGICSPCQERQMADLPVLVVSPARATKIPLLQSLLSGAPDVAIVVDRRSGERRNGHDHDLGNGHGNGHGHGKANGHAKANGNGHGRERDPHAELAADRRSRDRRRHPALYVV